MTTLEFLSQAYRLDLRIDCKLAQIAALNELATKCTSTLSDMPHQPNYSVSSMAEAVSKIVDLQKEIDVEIHQLIDIKRQIVNYIKAVENKECQTLLELRFLCGWTWEEIAFKMGYSIQHTFRMREKALKQVVIEQSGE